MPAKTEVPPPGTVTESPRGVNRRAQVFQAIIPVALAGTAALALPTQAQTARPGKLAALPGARSTVPGASSSEPITEPLPFRTSSR